MKNLLAFLVCLIWCLKFAVSQNGDLTWYKTDVPAATSYTAITSDSTGQYLIASSSYKLFLSNDSGVSWTQSPNFNIDTEWSSLASDVTGQYISGTTSDVGIMNSNNYGKYFSFSFMISDYKPFTSVTMSSNGMYQYATSYGDYIYNSSDYGVSFAAVHTNGPTLTTQNWQVIETNGNGSIVLAGITGGLLYYSHDYAATWSQSTGGVGGNWISIASNVVGDHIAAVLQNGAVYLSIDYGASWQDVLVVPLGTALTSVCCDATGRYLAVTAYPGGIYLNDQYGDATRWTLSTATTQNYVQIACNADGNYLVTTTTNSGHIYTTYNITQGGVPVNNDDQDDVDPNSFDDNSNDSDKLSTTFLIIIIVGGVVLLLLAAGFAYFAVKGKSLSTLCCVQKDGLDTPLV